MLKLTSLALGLLTLISIVPSAQAFPVVIGDTRNSQPEVKVIINPQVKTENRRDDYRTESRRDNNYNYRLDAERRRQIEIAREREARERWEAKHRRHGYYSQKPSYSSTYHSEHNEHREDRGGYYNSRDRH
jgi:hypothetical protein